MSEWKHVIEKVEFVNPITNLQLDPNSAFIKGYSYNQETGNLRFWRHAWNKENANFKNQTSISNDKINHLSSSKLANCLDYFIEESNLKSKVAIQSRFTEYDTINKAYYEKEDGSIESKYI